MEYLEYSPSVHLAPYVECYWSAYSEKPPFRERENLIPDGTIELMFNFGDPYSQLIGDKNKTVNGAHIIGIRKHSLIISQTSIQDFFCIRFKLGGTYPFFKIPVHLFSNAFYGLEELFGNTFKALEEQLYETRNNRKRVAIVEKFLLNKLNDRPDDYLFVYKSHKRLIDHPTRISQIVSQFNTNYKTLERKFMNVLGITPAELIKIKRFNAAVLAMYSCHYGSLTQIGYACGYYDQSHFIREFKQLTGFTPREFLREQFTIVQVIQPALAERMSKSYNSYI